VALYLLDTSVCVPVLRERASVRELPAPADTAVPSIVAAELARLAEFLEIFAVIDFSHDSARHYGEIRVELEKRGTPIGPLDLLIAAQARSLGATLLTANVGEFRRVKGLKVLSWK
jgi:tRNA(fMet)-specific endonuclease VapC